MARLRHIYQRLKAFLRRGRVVATSRASKLLPHLARIRVLAKRWLFASRRFLRRTGAFLVDAWFCACDIVREKLQPSDKARIVGPYLVPHAARTRTLCVMAHYDRDRIVDDYVLYYLRALHGAGCSTVFVSTSELTPSAVDAVRRYCEIVIVRKNYGYDFGSWQTGLEAAGPLEAYDRILLVNDSVYGPLRRLETVFEEMGRREVDFWGITDSHEKKYHLQSYFLCFNKNVTSSREFKSFWQGLARYSYKTNIIRYHEVGLSQALIKSGFRPGALCEYDRVRDNGAVVQEVVKRMMERGPVNPMHFLWDCLLLEFGCPFVKVALLRDNPGRVGNIAQWRQVLRSCADYDVRLIENHLARMGAWEIARAA